MGLALLIQRVFRFSIAHISQCLWIGMLTASVLALISGFYTALNFSFEIFLILLSFLGMIMGWKQMRYLFSFKTYYFTGQFWIGIVILLFIISFGPFILDHFGYYVPTLSVLNSRGIQIGVANIELVLGQNSLWHFLQASVDEILDTHLRLNGFLVILYLIYCFEQQKTYLLLFLPFFAIFSHSPSPDLPIYILSIYIVHEFFVHKNASLIVLFGLSFWAVTIKLTAFWLPLGLSIVVLLKLAQGESLRWKFPIIFVLILVGLSGFKNFLSSSNVLFPYGNSYWESQWRPDDRIIEQSAQFAQMKSYNFQYPYEEIQKFNIFESLLNWMQLGGIKGIQHIFIVFIVIFFSYWVWKNAKKKYYILSLLLILKCVLVFSFSAQARFLWDAILVMLLVFVMSFQISTLYRILSILGLSWVAFLFCVPSVIQKNADDFALSSMFTGFHSSQWVKPYYYKGTFSSGYSLGNLEYNMPENYPFLFDSPFVSLSESDVAYYKSLGIFPQWEEGKIVMKKIEEIENKSRYRNSDFE